jgi:hypothetical protein
VYIQPVCAGSFGRDIGSLNRIQPGVAFSRWP